MVLTVSSKCTFCKYANVPDRVLVLTFRSGGSVVGIATRHRLGGPEFEFWWGQEIYLHPSRPTLGHTQPCIHWVTGGFSPGINQPGRSVNHRPLSSTEVKETVELYLYSPLSVPSWQVTGGTRVSRVAIE